MEGIRVKVRIYGQEYTISGERDPESIIEIANYVDEKMREIGRHANGMAPGSLATLASVNIADELFEARENLEKAVKDKAQLEEDAQHYMKLWDEAKQNFVQYKEGALKADDDKKETQEYIEKLEQKVKEFESAYFDLQMENIQLKDKLDKLGK